MKKSLVIGASKNPERYSNMAIERLVQKDYPVVAIGLRPDVVHGIKVETSLVPFQDIDTVTLYIGPKNQAVYTNYIVSLKPNRVIFNPGTENESLANVLTQNGINVEYACTLVLLSRGVY